MFGELLILTVGRTGAPEIFWVLSFSFSLMNQIKGNSQQVGLQNHQTQSFCGVKQEEKPFRHLEHV